MFFVYVLFSFKDHRLYVGYTEDLEARMKKHLQGLVPATQQRLPLQLIYYEAYPTMFEAKRREKYLKGGNGRAQLKRQLSETLVRIGYRHISNDS
ncbi:GIY-YIG nuclease family protein [Candidatus Uhrbacteria bacterium]|nr:GIY-YIG nuclease family protein [Candidatus Uhrbacteria bacterium]